MRMGPRWYPIALAALAVPQCWLGGKLYEVTKVNRGHKGGRLRN
jgi:hypothetical protein